jgi:hypothetical protein
MVSRPRHVRSSPQSRHSSARVARPPCAKRGLSTRVNSPANDYPFAARADRGCSNVIGRSARIACFSPVYRGDDRVMTRIKDPTGLQETYNKRLNVLKNLERAMGFEPTTPTLARFARYSQWSRRCRSLQVPQRHFGDGLQSYQKLGQRRLPARYRHDAHNVP